MQLFTKSLLGWMGAALLLAAPAAAEEARFSVERFRPAIDGNGLIDVDSGDVGSHLDFSLGAFANYALNPLVLRNGQERVGALVAHRVGLDLVAAVSLFEWVEVGVDAPLLLFQARDTQQVKDAVIGASDLSAVGVGDLRLMTKVRVLRARDQFVDVAVIPAITVPTGFPAGDTGNYVGEGQITFAPEIAVSRSFTDSGALHGLQLAANVGYRLRPEERHVVNVTIGHELTYRAGLGYRLANTPVQFDVSANGGTYAFAPFTSGFEENPLEVLADVSWDPLPGLRTSAGVGKGILSGFGTPDFRAFVGIRLVPVSDDRDHDGIVNDNDRCPDDPEDKDGWQDSDGCPDLDNDNDQVLDVDDGAPNDPEDKDGWQDGDGVPDPDNDKDGIVDGEDECPLQAGPLSNHGCPITDRDGDGVLNDDDRCPDVPGLVAFKGCPDTDGDGFSDPDDKCPNEPEVVNNFQDDDGCPDKGKTVVKVTKEKIEILDKVYFDTGKDTIQSRSFPLLDQVVTVLKNHPELTRTRIEGHTDSDGSDELNLDLSDRRSKSVLRYLVGKGVGPARLQAVGYGETRPVAPNDSKQNKEKNRRVEFVIVEIDGKPAEQPAKP